MKPPSLRTTISLRAARGILLRVSVVAAGCDQASSRSVPISIKCRRSRSPNGAGFLASSVAIFDPVHDLQRLVPASLQLAGYEAISGIDRVILSTRVSSLVARLLKRKCQLPLCS